VKFTLLLILYLVKSKNTRRAIMVSISTINKITQGMQQRGHAGKFGRTGGANGSIFGGVNRTGTNLNARPVASAGSANPAGAAGGASAANNTGSMVSDGTVIQVTSAAQLAEIINSGSNVHVMISGSKCPKCGGPRKDAKQAAADLEGTDVIIVEIKWDLWSAQDQAKYRNDMKKLGGAGSGFQYPQFIEYKDGQPVKTGHGAKHFKNLAADAVNNNKGATGAGVCVGPDCEDKEPVCVGPDCGDNSTGSNSATKALPTKRIFSTSRRFR